MLFYLTLTLFNHALRLKGCSAPNAVVVKMPDSVLFLQLPNEKKRSGLAQQTQYVFQTDMCRLYKSFGNVLSQSFDKTF